MMARGDAPLRRGGSHGGGARRSGIPCGGTPPPRPPPRRGGGRQGISGGEGFAEGGVDEGGVGGVEEGHVAPDRGDGAPFAAGDLAGLVLAVDRREVAVVLAGDDESARLDRRQRAPEIAAIV